MDATDAMNVAGQMGQDAFAAIQAIDGDDEDTVGKGHGDEADEFQA